MTIKFIIPPLPPKTEALSTIGLNKHCPINSAYERASVTLGLIQLERFFATQTGFGRTYRKASSGEVRLAAL